MKLDFFDNNCNLPHAALVEKKMICFAGYVLRLCPFEDVAMVGLAADDVEAFLQVKSSVRIFEQIINTIYISLHQIILFHYL